MPVGGSGGLRGSVRGSGGSFSMHSLLQSYSSALRRPRSLGRSLSSYLNHTTHLGTFTRTYMHAHRGRECDVCEVAHCTVGMGIARNLNSSISDFVFLISSVNDCYCIHFPWRPVVKQWDHFSRTVMTKQLLSLFVVKESFSQKWNSCPHLLTLKLFQTCMHFCHLLQKTIYRTFWECVLDSYWLPLIGQKDQSLGTRKLFGCLHSSKYHLLCSAEERNSYRFGITCKWWQNLHFWANYSFTHIVIGFRRDKDSKDTIIFFPELYMCFWLWNCFWFVITVLLKWSHTFNACKTAYVSWKGAFTGAFKGHFFIAKSSGLLA